MLITPIIGYVKSLFQSLNKPQTYVSALEAYIVSNNPHDASDIDRLTREFDQKRSFSKGWMV